ncbi:protein of unknown function [Shewanella benthica]|uniref:Uncharacterized protein n=1 Tax=Shewanella benthica TaxID=43661 RepID=A0A330M349_9GAMM|nr:hypothetical protein [Shewanella benthica]SQH75460.1 protein of unknown function [Shewanella benthica]
MIKHGLLFIFAVFIFTLNINVSPNPSGLLESSHHLGINSAYAARDKMTDEDDDDDGDGIMEHFEIEGEEWDDYWEGWDDDDWDDEWNAYNWDDEDWDDFEDNEEELELTPVQQCLIGASQGRRICRNTANALAVTGGILCVGFAPNLIAVATCEGVNAIAHDDALSQCDIAFETKKFGC